MAFSAVDRLPEIVESDYSRFQEMIAELPTSHALWLDYLSTSRSVPQPKIRGISITPAEFRRYWYERGNDGNGPASLALLARCTAHMFHLAKSAAIEADASMLDLLPIFAAKGADPITV